MMLFADSEVKLKVDEWSVAPFVLLLLAIALLPIFAAKFWHSNWRKALVSIGLAVPVVAYVVSLHAVPKLQHALMEYVEFIVLLAALFIVAGGIAVQGQFRPTPWVNVGILALGAVLSNFIGTTGASMLLIRPFLRINLVRANRNHLPILFIFVVSNLGGLLTALGDPPLFLGFLNGVSFFWTLRMFPIWLLVNGLVLVVAWIWDVVAYAREPNTEAFPPRHGSFVVAGAVNFVFLAGIIAAILCRSKDILGDAALPGPWSSAIMAGMAILSLLFTPRSVREHNEFTFEPIVEVAVLFIGIFVTMLPALVILQTDGHRLGVNEPWQYFWLAGVLSSFLDNAPTYMAFATLAAAPINLALAPFAAEGQLLTALSENAPLKLEAISAGAVFMGANTYIGNGPNFMVKSIAEGMGYKMPSFFGYSFYACMVLLPIFALATWVFFV